MLFAVLPIYFKCPPPADMTSILFYKTTNEHLPDHHYASHRRPSPATTSASDPTAVTAQKTLPGS